jgi:hypothetical protein
MEEFGYKPVNKYLPPRAPAAAPAAAAPQEAVPAPRDRLEQFFAWVDRRLSP